MQREIMTSIPFLSQPSAAAENTEEDLAVAQDLKDTLDAHRNGCVGMAANMIGVPKRIIAFVDEDFGGRIFVHTSPPKTARSIRRKVASRSRASAAPSDTSASKWIIWIGNSASATQRSPVSPRRSSNTRSTTAMA